MGDPKKKSKQYEKPLRPWDRARLEKERETKKNYGLKNKKELWRIETTLRKKRKNARTLLALEPEARAKREKELVESLVKYGIVSQTAMLDDILGLGIESFLERRLQTMVYRKGLALTPAQARQFVVHGHIAVNGKKVSTPSYLVPLKEENSISYYGKKINIELPQRKEELKKKFESVQAEEEQPAEGEGEVEEKQGEETEESTAGEEAESINEIQPEEATQKEEKGMGE